MGRSQTIFLMIVFIFWPLEQSAFLDKLELQNAMWIRVNCKNTTLYEVSDGLTCEQTDMLGKIVKLEDAKCIYICV